MIDPVDLRFVQDLRNLEIELAPFDEVCARADFLTVHTPLTPETRGIVDREAIGKMKTGARIINCARGGLVDEDALYDALTSGAIAGAALDVFTEEPPPADHKLLQLEQVMAVSGLQHRTGSQWSIRARLAAEPFNPMS